MQSDAFCSVNSLAPYSLKDHFLSVGFSFRTQVITGRLPLGECPHHLTWLQETAVSSLRHQLCGTPSPEKPGRRVLPNFPDACQDLFSPETFYGKT